MKQSTMHFKMTNGEEVICQVIDWAEGEEDAEDYIVRNALNVIQTTVRETHTRYMFKPWFTMAESSDQYICISKEHIVACTLPNDTLYNEYRRAVNQMIVSGKRKTDTPANEPMPGDDDFLARNKQEYDKVQKEILELFQEMEKQTNLNEEFDILNDSDEPSNIIKFPGPDSIH